MVGFHNHPMFNPIKHLFIPMFGLLANLACMAFYLIGPFMGYGTPRGTAARLGNRRRLGDLRRNLLHVVQ